MPSPRTPSNCPVTLAGHPALSEPAIEFDGGLFTKGWQRSLHGTGFTFADAKSGTCAFALKLSETEQVAAQVKVVPAAESALRRRVAAIERR